MKFITKKVSVNNKTGQIIFEDTQTNRDGDKSFNQMRYNHRKKEAKNYKKGKEKGLEQGKKEGVENARKVYQNQLKHKAQSLAIDAKKEIKKQVEDKIQKDNSQKFVNGYSQAKKQTNEELNQTKEKLDKTEKTKDQYKDKAKEHLKGKKKSEFNHSKFKRRVKQGIAKKKGQALNGALGAGAVGIGSAVGANKIINSGNETITESLNTVISRPAGAKHKPKSGSSTIGNTAKVGGVAGALGGVHQLTKDDSLAVKLTDNLSKIADH